MIEVGGRAGNVSIEAPLVHYVTRVHALVYIITRYRF